MFGEKTIAIFRAFILFNSSSTTSARRLIAQLSSAASVGFNCFTSSTDSSSVLHRRTSSGDSPSSIPEGSSLNQALIRPAKQWTLMSSGTMPLFNWLLTSSSWLFSGFIRNIPSAFNPSYEYNLSRISKRIVGTLFPFESKDSCIDSAGTPNMTQEMDTGSELEGPTSDYEERAHSIRRSEDEDEVRVFVKTLRGEQNCRKQPGAIRSTNRRVARGISEPSKLLELQHGLWHIIL